MVDNIWIIKAILRGFELASGLGVYFQKSNLIGINVDPSFLALTEDFLHYNIESILFKYLELLVGANP